MGSKDHLRPGSMGTLTDLLFEAECEMANDGVGKHYVTVCQGAQTTRFRHKKARKVRESAKPRIGLGGLPCPCRAGKGPIGPRFFPMEQAPQVVTASDCSGLDTVTAALRMAGVPARTAFLSESDKTTRKVLKANFARNGAFGEQMPRISNDLTERDDSLLTDEGIDLYTAGPPCQPFSMAGLKKGLSDPRGLIILRVLMVIQTVSPSTFALENVKPLATHKRWRPLFNFIVGFLRGILDADNQPMYEVDWKASVSFHFRVVGLPFLLVFFL